MLRLSPRARALWERARRPLTMFAIGVGLAAPASAFLMREDAGKTSVAAVRTSSAASTAGMAAVATSGEAAEAQLTLGLSKLYEVPLGLAAQIQKAANSAGITPRLAMGLVHTESEFKRTAVSPVGAIGYTQVMPGTARDLKPGTTRSDLFDGTTNLQLGFKYLKSLIDHYDGDIRLALTAYNRGPGIVDRLVKKGRDPENGYASKVLADPSTLNREAEVAQHRDAAAAAERHSTHHASKHRATHRTRHATSRQRAHPARKRHRR